MRDGFNFVNFLIVAPTFRRWDRPVIYLHGNFGDIRGYYGKILLWAHLCKRGRTFGLL